MTIFRKGKDGTIEEMRAWDMGVLAKIKEI